MKNRLPALILAQPAGFQRHAARLVLAVGMPHKNLPQQRQPPRKIGQDFSRDFAFVAARPQDARNQDPAWSFKAQWETGPFSGSCLARPQGRRPMESRTAKQSIFKDFQRESL